MQCMLDTDHCVYLIGGSSQVAPKASMNDCLISAIVAGELQTGVAKSHEANRDRNRQALVDFLSMVRTAPIDEHIVEAYTQVRAYLETSGQRI